MVVKLKKIIKPEKYLTEFKRGEEFCIGINLDEKSSKRAKTYALENPEKQYILKIPKGMGRTTLFNVEGKKHLDRSGEKEWRSIESTYHIKDWHGNTHDGTCFKSRPCWAVEFEEPTCIELMINESVIKSKNIIYDESNFDLIKIIMNIFLEIFGEFEIWDLNSLPVEKQIKIKRVPWTVLPKGKYPWEKAKVFLKEFLDRVPEKQRKIISNRQKTISQYEPDFMAVGGEEFWGYVIYGFEKKNLFVFESNQINNATYIFKGEWEDASSLTKREIISRDLCEKRIIHTENWENTIQKLLKSNRKSEC